MKTLAAALLVLLVGCGGSYKREGMSIITYCVIGGVYVEEATTTLENENGKPTRHDCPSTAPE